jgi:hypothetical protein
MIIVTHAELKAATRANFVRAARIFATRFLIEIRKTTHWTCKLRVHCSINLHRRAFAVFDAALLGAFFAERGDPQFPNFVVDLAERGFGKFVRRLHCFLEFRDAAERAISLVARQRVQNLANVFDFRNAMTNHHEIVSGVDRETNRVLQTVSVQDRSHVEIVGHDEAVETEFVAEQIGNDTPR